MDQSELTDDEIVRAAERFEVTMDSAVMRVQLATDFFPDHDLHTIDTAIRLVHQHLERGYKITIGVPHYEHRRV